VGNLLKDRYVERLIYTRLRGERFRATVKAARGLEVLKHRDFVDQSVAYVYLHKGQDNLLEGLALRLDGLDSKTFFLIIF
jgi:hypothetical protein